MRLLFLDFESYYDNIYSLRKMTPAEYILDSRWEIHMVGVAIDDGPIQIIAAEDFAAFLKQFPP